MRSILRIALAALFSLTAFFHVSAQEANGKTTSTFKVEGLCGMCKSNIEEAAYIKGVKFTEWDRETKMLTVIFKTNKVTEQDIHDAISVAGYDTPLAKATTDNYDALPGCCKYRPE